MAGFRFCYNSGVIPLPSCSDRRLAISSFLFIAFVFSLAFPAHAATRDRGISTSHLDDDPVMEFSVPVLFGVTLSSVVPDFGAPRGGGTRQHEGQDFMVPLGTPIISPTEAVVTSVGDGESSGNYVTTANPGGERFRYMHLDTIADIKRGTRLKAGDFIGTVGDTGNAPPGAYHLHFEVWDEDGRAVDPYPRLKENLTLKEKMAFLPGILRSVRGDEDDYAELLVTTFKNDFARAAASGVSLPRKIEAALKKAGVAATVKDQASIRELLATLPALLPAPLSPGDSGPRVQLLQFFIIFFGDGPAALKLATSGPTGYYGPVTAAAVAELQAGTDVRESGVFDADTKRAWQTYQFE